MIQLCGLEIHAYGQNIPKGGYKSATQSLREAHKNRRGYKYPGGEQHSSRHGRQPIEVPKVAGALKL